MRRREFVSVGISVATALSVRHAASQPRNLIGTRTRAAVAIGVESVGNLPRLRGAAAGARAIADWLSAEEFEVTLIVDTAKAVTATEIFTVIATLVNRGTLEQLIVYFAGHGFVSSYSEYWLLSGAPANPNEAVSLVESVVLAKQSAIPNVVFISDACRSRADSIRTEHVRGSLVFPTSGSRSDAVSDVDVFFATLVGDPAWEVPVAESVASYQGIYTATFLEAFRRPYDTMVKTVDGKQVVPNGQLKAYLAREVPKRAQEKSIQLVQKPDSQVVSPETTYIGRVLGRDRVRAGNEVPQPTVVDVAQAELARVGWGGFTASASTAPPREIALVAAKSGFDSARNALVGAQGTHAVPAAETGFGVYGANLVAVTSNPKFIRATFSNSNPPASDSKQAIIQIDLQNMRAASLAVRFDSGFGALIPVFKGYTGSVYVSDQTITNLTYVPSDDKYWVSFTPEEKKTRQHRIKELDAVVATAARLGVFRIEGTRKTKASIAAQLEKKIATVYSYNPAVGLFLAYAYSDAGLDDDLKSYALGMKFITGPSFFDVAMLCDDLAGAPVSVQNHCVPFVPVLSQGWALLRVKNVVLPDGIMLDHVRPGFWTSSKQREWKYSKSF